MIIGEVVNFRALEEKDLRQLRDWRNQSYVRKSCREYLLLNMENQVQWFKSLHKKPPNNIMFGIENKKGELIGVCGLTWIDWKNRNAEVSIYIGEKDWQGKGVANESIDLLLQYGFNTLNMHKIYAMIFAFNEASITLFEKSGFILEGSQRESHYIDGKYWNVLLYGILKEEYLVK